MKNLDIKQLIRYFFSGCAGAIVQFSALYILHDYFGVYYLVASPLAVMIALVVGFVLQKFWTFKGNAKKLIGKQAVWYFALFLANLVVNTVLMYVLVDIVGMWYISAQFITTVLIAAESFVVYRQFIFKVEDHEHTDTHTESR